ncbi:hypothetical protein LAT59_04110, partial [Candidatus Gracilibacteria bacterium]|nr:hypothetical protein [Candidatus Gracilibacteria bacterium]
MIQKYPRGSEWRKWDLHFHTLSSYDYHDKSVANVDIINQLSANSISVVAITDHHVIDINRIQELQMLGKEKNITVFPGIEFLSDARGSDPIHFIGIFSNYSDIDYIWGQIQNNTSIKKVKGEGKNINEVYCDLEDTIRLVKELGGVTTIHSGQKHGSIESITNSLPHTIAQKKDIAELIDIYELGKEEDQQGYIEKVFPVIGKVLPMIICSDNHNVKKYVTKQNCWIKADPTFEGLKQIIYEPEERVKIQEYKPSENLNKISEIELNFKNDIKIKANGGSDEYNFCFSDVKEKLYLSNYFNCFVGGRGSGKSSLLNLIYENITGEKDTYFLSNNTFTNLD